VKIRSVMVSIFKLGQNENLQCSRPPPGRASVRPLLDRSHTQSSVWVHTPERESLKNKMHKCRLLFLLFLLQTPPGILLTATTAIKIDKYCMKQLIF